MQYFWLLDGETQQYIKFYYQPGLENLVDYPSKHHTADIHRHIRPYYIHIDNSPTLLPRAMKPSTRQGCAEILGDPYSKKSPLPSIGISPHLAASPVCVNSTSGGERSLATPAHQGRLALVFLPLGAAANKIKSATLTLPNA